MNAALYVVAVAQCVCAAVGAGRAEGRRTCTLYCRVGIGFHLQIHEDGRVNGSHEPNPRSVLELFAVSQGIIGIRGVYSNRYLAMNHRGRLHAQESFSDDCKFRERFQDNSYNTYSSVTHMTRRSGRQWYVALNKRGKAKMGSSPKVKAQHESTHFLPRGGGGAEGGASAARGQGFTVTTERRDPPPPPPPLKRQAAAKTRAVKYWPKYRFG